MSNVTSVTEWIKK